MPYHESRPFYDRIDDFVPSVSLDCVVFGYKDKGLHVLLLKYKNTDTWALPGGFLPMDAEMEEVVTDILFERTGVRDIYLNQFHTFSSPTRGWKDRDRHNYEVIKSLWPVEYQVKLDKWFDQRFISTAFMALIDASLAKPVPDELSDDCSWVSLNDLPAMALDHEEIIQEAQRQLRQRINNLPLGRSLLPNRFTMSDLQSLYEAVLGKKLDRGNFQRKIMKLGILHRHEKLMTGASNKAPYLYSIDSEIYDRLLSTGIGFI